MKIFQILNGFCHWDATEVLLTVEEAERRFSSDMHFTEAPDYVFEGWGYDDTADGDERFIRPEAPEGWIYDETTGTFYREGEEPGTEDADVWDELARAYETGVNEA